MAIVIIPNFYATTTYKGNDLLPIWRTDDGSMYKLPFNDFYLQLEASLGSTTQDPSISNLYSTKFGEPSLGSGLFYQDGKIDVSSGFNAWNGLQYTDNSIGLGGALKNGLTSISGSGTSGLSLYLDQNLSLGAANNSYLLGGAVLLQTTSYGTQVSLNDTTQRILLSSQYTNQEIDMGAGGITIKDVSSGAMKYAADYSSSMNNVRAIPDVGFLYAAIDACAAGSLTGWNGITITDNSVGLGGTLELGTTNISSNTLDNNAAFEIFLDASDGSYADLTMYNDLDTQGVELYAQNGAATYTRYSALAIRDNEVALYHSYNGGVKRIDIESSLFLITDDIQNAGMNYANDYSAQGIALHGDRWIPDKGYVDSAASVNAWNGLTKTVDNSLGLGGILLQDADITVPDGTQIRFDDASLGTGVYTVHTSISSASGINLGNYVLNQGFYVNKIFATGIDTVKMSNDAMGITMSNNNGTLPGIQVTDESTGLYYNADYSTTQLQGARWIPDKGYVDSVASGSTEAWEGLTKTDNSIGLGGFINNGALMTVNSDDPFRVHDASNLSDIFLYKSNGLTAAGISLGSYNGDRGLALKWNHPLNSASIRLGMTQTYLSWTSNNSGVTRSESGILVGDQSTGLRYQADYSASQIAGDRWIPDKGYVDSVAGGGTEAWNGLTKTDSSIGLGGTLVDNTIITTPDTGYLWLNDASQGVGIYKYDIATFVKTAGITFGNYFSTSGLRLFTNLNTTQRVVTLNTGGGTGIEMERQAAGNSLGIRVQDISTGLYYTLDFSSTQTQGDRWIPDKGYVDTIDTTISKNTAYVIAASSISWTPELNSPIRPYNSIDSAIIAAFGAASSTNRYQVKVMPGVYTLSGTQTLRANVDLYLEPGVILTGSVDFIWASGADANIYGYGEIRSTNTTRNFEIQTINNKDTNVYVELQSIDTSARVFSCIGSVGDWIGNFDAYIRDEVKITGDNAFVYFANLIDISCGNMSFTCPKVHRTVPGTQSMVRILSNERNDPVWTFNIDRLIANMTSTNYGLDVTQGSNYSNNAKAYFNIREFETNGSGFILGSSNANSNPEAYFMNTHFKCISTNSAVNGINLSVSNGAAKLKLKNVSISMGNTSSHALERSGAGPINPEVHFWGDVFTNGASTGTYTSFGGTLLSYTGLEW